MRCTALLALLGAAALTTGCGGAKTEPPAKAPGANAPRVFLIIGENTSASQITAAHAPYLVHSLRPHAAWVTSYHSFTRSSSLGQYIAMTSGQFTRCEANNALPAGCHQSIDNVFSQLQATGRTWFEFNESAANPCDIVDHGAAWSKNIYSAHHNPALYYVGVHGKGYDEAITPDAACREHNLSAGTTAPNDTSTLDAALRSGRVGALNIVIPNDCENGHDPCATNDPVRQFDAFLAREVPKVRASPAYGANSTIVITWDEGADPPLNPGNPLLVALGPKVKTGVVSTGSYNHYSLLHSIEAQLGLPLLARARTQKPLPVFS